MRINLLVHFTWRCRVLNCLCDRQGAMEGTLVMIRCRSCQYYCHYGQPVLTFVILHNWRVINLAIFWSPEINVTARCYVSLTKRKSFLVDVYYLTWINFRVDKISRFREFFGFSRKLKICATRLDNMQNCPHQLLMQSCALWLYVICGSSNQIKRALLKFIRPKRPRGLKLLTRLRLGLVTWVNINFDIILMIQLITSACVVQMT